MAESSTITITVKTPKDKKDIEISADGKVQEFKEKVAAAFDSTVAQLCLIFAGKILKDESTLSELGIKDGITVHLVIKGGKPAAGQASGTAASTASAATTSAPAAPTPSSPGTGGTPNPPPSGPGAQLPFGNPLGGGSLGGLAGLGLGSANFADMQQRMQREVMQNPDMMRQMMDNPMVQQMMSNPDVMRNLMQSNPQMQELMDRNPEISHVLNNPELMRQTMEMVRNPTMLNELMRNHDRAMSNLESIPGGFNALQRMYRDVQEPMMSAAQEQFGGNPFASLAGQGQDSSAEQQQGRENNDPLPNPWGGPGGPGSSPAASTSGGATTAGSTPATGGANPPPSGTQQAFSSFNSAGMQSLLGQLSSNPQAMQNMIQAPYMRSMMQTMSSNPELAQQVMASNPMFAGNPQLQEQMSRQMPMFLQQMQTPAMQEAMTNPEALQAIMQIQQGMSRLQTAAPGIVQGMSLPGMGAPPGSSPAAPAGTPAGTAAPSGTSPSTAPPAGSGGSSTGQPQQPLPTGMGGADPLSAMMANLMGMVGSGTANQPPEQRYSAQLEQLAAMGFVDRAANLQALTATAGDVNGAIERLLQQR